MEFQLFTEGIRNRLAKMNVAGGDFTEREKAIISIVWNRFDEISQEIYQQMERQAIDEIGGCSACGSLDGMDCCCEDDFFEEEPEFEFDCALRPDGQCGAAGSEHCDFECPTRHQILFNQK